MKDKIESALAESHGYDTPDEPDDTAHSLQANLRIEKRDGDSGVLKESREVKNIITNQGADDVRTRVGSAPAANAYSITAIGNSSTAFASADTQLGSEVTRTANAFNTTANYGQFSNVTTYTNIANTIKESGLFNDGSGVNSGTMLAAQSFGAITLTTSDSLEVIWKVYFSEK